MYLSSVLRALKCLQFSELNHSFQDHTQAGFLKGTLDKRDVMCINAPDVIAVDSHVNSHNPWL